MAESKTSAMSAGPISREDKSKRNEEATLVPALADQPPTEIKNQYACIPQRLQACQNPYNRAYREILNGQKETPIPLYYVK